MLATILASLAIILLASIAIIAAYAVMSDKE